MYLDCQSPSGRLPYVLNVTAVKLSEEEWGGVDIESFTVKGFYLNRVWLSGYLDPAEPDNRPISEAGHVVNQSEAAKYDKQAYADAKAPFLCDEPADGGILEGAGGGQCLSFCGGEFAGNQPHGG